MQNNFIEKLNQIKSDFDFLDDWEDRYRHIIDIGKELSPISANEKNDENKVRGCASQVWLIKEITNDTKKVKFRGESDSTLVQGLLAILINIYNNLSPQEIIENPPEKVFDELNLQEALTPSRSNGLKSMASKIMEFARANI